MASNLFISNQAGSTGIAAIGAQLNGGFIDLYAGTQPADANTNTSGSEYILAEITFSTTAGSAASTTWTAASMVATTATSTGICTFYFAYSSSRARVMT